MAETNASPLSPEVAQKLIAEQAAKTVKKEETKEVQRARFENGRGINRLRGLNPQGLSQRVRVQEANRYIQWFKERNGKVPDQEQVRAGLRGEDTAYLDRTRNMTPAEVKSERRTLAREQRQYAIKAERIREAANVLVAFPAAKQQEVRDILRQADNGVLNDTQREQIKAILRDEHISEEQITGFEAIAEKNYASTHAVQQAAETIGQRITQTLQEIAKHFPAKQAVAFAKWIDRHVGDNVLKGAAVVGIGASALALAHFVLPPVAIVADFYIGASLLGSGVSLATIPFMLSRTARAAGAQADEAEKASRSGQKFSSEIRGPMSLLKYPFETFGVRAIQAKASEHLHSVSNEFYLSYYRFFDAQGNLKRDSVQDPASQRELLGLFARVNAGDAFQEAHENKRFAWRLDNQGGEQQFNRDKARVTRQVLENIGISGEQIDIAVQARKTLLDAQLRSDSRTVRGIAFRRILLKSIPKLGSFGVTAGVAAETGSIFGGHGLSLQIFQEAMAKGNLAARAESFHNVISGTSVDAVSGGAGSGDHGGGPDTNHGLTGQPDQNVANDQKTLEQDVKGLGKALDDFQKDRTSGNIGAESRDIANIFRYYAGIKVDNANLGKDIRLSQFGTAVNDNLQQAQHIGQPSQSAQAPAQHPESSAPAAPAPEQAQQPFEFSGATKEISLFGTNDHIKIPANWIIGEQGDTHILFDNHGNPVATFTDSGGHITYTYEHNFAAANHLPETPQQLNPESSFSLEGNTSYENFMSSHNLAVSEFHNYHNGDPLVAHNWESYGIHDEVIYQNGQPSGIGITLYDLHKFPGPNGWMNPTDHLGSDGIRGVSIYDEHLHERIFVTTHDGQIRAVFGDNTPYTGYDAQGHPYAITSNDIAKLLTTQQKLQDFASHGGQSGDFSSLTQQDYVNHIEDAVYHQNSHTLDVFAQNQAKGYFDGNTPTFSSVHGTGNTFDFASKLPHVPGGTGEEAGENNNGIAQWIEENGEVALHRFADGVQWLQDHPGQSVAYALSFAGNLALNRTLIRNFGRFTGTNRQKIGQLAFVGAVETTLLLAPVLGPGIAAASSLGYLTPFALRYLVINPAGWVWSHTFGRGRGAPPVVPARPVIAPAPPVGAGAIGGAPVGAALPGPGGPAAAPVPPVIPAGAPLAPASPGGAPVGAPAAVPAAAGGGAVPAPAVVAGGIPPGRPAASPVPGAPVAAAAPVTPAPTATAATAASPTGAPPAAGAATVVLTPTPTPGPIAVPVGPGAIRAGMGTGLTPTQEVQAIIGWGHTNNAFDPSVASTNTVANQLITGIQTEARTQGKTVPTEAQIVSLVGILASSSPSSPLDTNAIIARIVNNLP